MSVLVLLPPAVAPIVISIVRDNAIGAMIFIGLIRNVLSKFCHLSIGRMKAIAKKPNMQAKDVMKANDIIASTDTAIHNPIFLNILNTFNDIPPRFCELYNQMVILY